MTRHLNEDLELILEWADAVQGQVPDHFDIVFGWGVQVVFRQETSGDKLSGSVQELVELLKKTADKEEKRHNERQAAYRRTPSKDKGTGSGDSSDTTATTG